LVTETEDEGKLEGKLFDFNLATEEETLILRYDVKMSDKGFLVGTHVAGLEWPHEVPSGKGLCYAVNTFDENAGEDPNEIFTFDIYYYSFADKKTSRLHSVQGNTLDYIGGDESAFVVKMPRSGIKKEDEKLRLADIYIKEDGTYIRHPIPELNCLDVMGSGVIGNGGYIVYGEGVYYVDANNKEYDRIKYFVGDTDDLGLDDLDIYDEVTGYYFDETAFYFTSIDDDAAITLHKVAFNN
jgi:hypothetical protein